jgi:hypothetical protein
MRMNLRLYIRSWNQRSSSEVTFYEITLNHRMSGTEICEGELWLEMCEQGIQWFWVIS